MSGTFGRTEPVKFAGAESRDPFAYRFYDPDRVVLGKRLEDLLRPAVCYWHSFGYDGLDPFGGQTMDRPWAGKTIADSKRKADAVFEFLSLLGVPYFTFHDRDIAPEGSSLAEYERNVREMAAYLREGMDRSGKRVLWGTANLFYDKRFMAGAATNPDPDVFAYAATQVKTAIEVTHQLDGANYVVWGGREGYETLLNTDLRRELDQLGRFISLLVEHKHRIGFKGTILIEPKPQEPTKHQYDFDVATVYGFLCRYGLQHEVKVNIEAAHAILAGHSFEHEIALANALGVFGSIDINRNDYQSGWDTDQFPTNAAELVSDATIVVSEYERSLLAAEVPDAKVVNIPILRSPPATSLPAFAERTGILFVGGFRHRPNVDAVMWFAREVWPLLRQSGFDAPFSVVGSHMPDDFRFLANLGITVRGFVDDLGALLDSTRLTIAPLRYGAGLKGKVITSLSYGVPVVGTSIAVEGSDLRHLHDVVVADEAAPMADAILSVHNDASVWSDLSRRGRETFLARFSTAAVSMKLISLMDGLVPPRRREGASAVSPSD